MLPTPAIQKRLHPQIHNRFIFLSSPHPMLLWVTLLYTPEIEPKWLPCYLDMQSSHNRQIVTSLVNNKSYPLIIFTLEPPHSCIHILNSEIDPNQQQKLKLSVEQSQKLPL
ncbi:hypothetical protein [Nostoc sp. CMAA1605]|uniref:hypothetical protein n=1 Tax=Nostoc sp. CMAA1605 TaxID=2055159 RepID=UPI001F344281|nr:hypothetical protein [Nostoc sp. CMAA1605]MCF4969427.1 hypothetical protein [Nostoc sp. CMAA1605]